MIVDPVFIAEVTAVMIIIASIAAGAFEILLLFMPKVKKKLYERMLKREFREDDEDEKERDV